MQPYYGNVAKIRCCPTATKLEWLDGSWSNPGPGHRKEPFRAWGLMLAMFYAPGDDPQTAEEYGSYGINGWLQDPLKETTDHPSHGAPAPLFWREINTIKNPRNVPYMLDAQWMGAYPFPGDNPPRYENSHWQESSQFARVVQNRHGRGEQNCAFMDGSARKVGLKELWTFKWHRGYDTSGKFTLADGADRALWEAYAPWMTSFKDY